ncbi:putative minor tail protein [Vibrio phage phiKT1028]|nr:putative minor tail protein [Vibrio phage phiKT1028]
MENVKILELDLLATNPDNYIDETQPVTNRTRDWYRPDYSPFYAEDFELFDGQGMLLKRGRDYVFESLSDELVGKTGKPVYLFFRIIGTNLNNKGSYRIKYRSVGNTGFPRSLIGKMTEELINSEYWVDWETQVLGKPQTYPAYQHWHDIATEVANWDQFISFAQAHLDHFTGGRKLHWEENEEKIDDAERSFSQRHDRFWRMLDRHDQDYDNPHKLVRSDFPLVHIPNFPLSTIQQDLEGKSATSFTTPLGLETVIKERRRINPGNIAAGRTRYHSPIDNLGVKPYLNVNVMKRGSWIKFPNGDMDFITAAEGGLYPAKVKVRDSKPYLTGVTYPLEPVYPQVGGEDLVMDRTIRVLGSGLAVNHHSDNLSLLFYPKTENYAHSSQTECFKVDMSEVAKAAHLGGSWVDKIWLFLVGNRLFGLGLVNTYARHSYRLFSAQTGELGSSTSIKLMPHSINVEDEDGLFGQPTTAPNLLDIIVGSGANEFQQFHHRFPSSVKPLFTNHMLMLTGDLDFRKEDCFFIKIVSTMTVNGVALPVEMSWTLDLNENKLLRNISGSNARTFTTLGEIKAFDEMLSKYCEGTGSIIPDFQFTRTGNLIANKIINFHSQSTHLNSITELHLKVIGPHLWDDYLHSGGDIQSPTWTVNKWELALMETTQVIFRGKLEILYPQTWDIRDYIGDMTSGTLVVSIGYSAGKLKLRLSTGEYLSPKETWLVNVDFDGQGISDVWS